MLAFKEESLPRLEICGFNVAGFIDDTLPEGSYVGPYKVIGNSKILDFDILDHKENMFTVSIGDPSVRRIRSEELVKNHMNSQI